MLLTVWLFPRAYSRIAQSWTAVSRASLNINLKGQQITETANFLLEALEAKKFFQERFLAFYRIDHGLLFQIHDDSGSGFVHGNLLVKPLRRAGEDCAYPALCVRAARLHFNLVGDDKGRKKANTVLPDYVLQRVQSFVFPSQLFNLLPFAPIANCG